MISIFYKNDIKIYFKEVYFMNLLIENNLVYALDAQTAEILQQEFPNAVSYRDPEGNLHPDYNRTYAARVTGVTSPRGLFNAWVI